VGKADDQPSLNAQTQAWFKSDDRKNKKKKRTALDVLYQKRYRQISQEKTRPPIAKMIPRIGVKANMSSSRLDIRQAKLMEVLRPQKSSLDIWEDAHGSWTRVQEEKKSKTIGRGWTEKQHLYIGARRASREEVQGDNREEDEEQRIED